MIIQCEKCRTKFRLDDSRVKEKGVKVRCTKCKNVFRVQKEAMPLEQQSAAVADAEIPFDTAVFEETPAESRAVEPCAFETAAFEADDLTVADGENVLTATVEPTEAGGDVDFSAFDFGEINSEPVSATPSTLSADDFMAVAETPLPRKEIPQGLDFSDDDMFGTAVQPASEVVSDAITFDFEGDSFAESMDMSGQDTRGKSSTVFALGASADEPFNLGEIDFGDELTSVAVQQVNPDNLKQSQEILFAPLADTQDKTVGVETLTQPLSGDDTPRNHDELPPLSITSRRKQSPFFGAVVGAISLMVILIIGYLGYLGYASVSTQKESGAKESGKISVKEVTAVFVENNQAGELLVISGEARNDFSKQRASLQVKVTVFDSTGQSIATKSAYGGNPLTEEQLESLPLDKIETAMANQFGDSLANMGVAPGDSIPFVVVLANLPKGAKDFVVEPVGSTVATGKQ